MITLIRKIIIKYIKEDLQIVVAIILAVLTVQNIWLIMTGLVIGDFNTPAISLQYRNKYKDTDGDRLPDIIEQAPKGAKVKDPKTGIVIGRGTGTNYKDKDSDNDLFTDGVENSLGSNPNNWFDPGYFYLTWILFILFLVGKNIFEGDRLKEYKDFDELQQSSGVASKGSKFAHGGVSVFSQHTKMTEKEKQELIKQDPRYHQMMGSQPKQKRKRKIKPKKLLLQTFISIFVIISIKFILSQ